VTADQPNYNPDKKMLTQQQGTPPPGQAEDEEGRQQLNAVIGNRVIHALGQPGRLHRVQVRRLWGDRYRVNILVGMDAASATVAHSYFLLADGEGNIIASNPQIMKQY
jgi:hypothetical protein